MSVHLGKAAQPALTTLEDDPIISGADHPSCPAVMFPSVVTSQLPTSTSPGDEVTRVSLTAGSGTATPSTRSSSRTSGQNFGPPSPGRSVLPPGSTRIAEPEVTGDTVLDGPPGPTAICRPAGSAWSEIHGDNVPSGPTRPAE